MYKGQIFNGLVWLVFVAIGYYMLIVPGVILHLFCIIGAASGDPTKQRMPARWNDLRKEKKAQAANTSARW